MEDREQTLSLSEIQRAKIKNLIAFGVIAWLLNKHIEGL